MWAWFRTVRRRWWAATAMRPLSVQHHAGSPAGPPRLDRSADGKTHAFKILRGDLARRQAGHFADVPFSIEFLSRPRRARGNLVQLDKVEAPDNRGRLHAEAAFGPFIGISSRPLPLIRSTSMRHRLRQKRQTNTTVGTGPLMSKSGRRVSSAAVSRIEISTSRASHIDEIYWHVIPDAPRVRELAYETGKARWLPGGSWRFRVPRLKATQRTCVTGDGWSSFSPILLAQQPLRAPRTRNPAGDDVAIVEHGKDVSGTASARSRPDVGLGDQVYPAPCRKRLDRPRRRRCLKRPATTGKVAAASDLWRTGGRWAKW